MFKRLIIFGASRGLGRSVALHSLLHLENLSEICLVARKEELLLKTASEIKQRNFPGKIDVMTLDLANENTQVNVEDFDLVIYCAGGGPHGEYLKKEWKDHRWAMEVNLLAPARLLHQWLKLREGDSEKGKFVVVGSRIAENNPDPLAASYSSGKSGLYGLLNSLQPELEKQSNKAWLFSPGYMDTELLPLSAKVRHDGSKLMSADAAAQALLRWIKQDGPWHRVLN